MKPHDPIAVHQRFLRVRLRALERGQREDQETTARIKAIVVPNGITWKGQHSPEEE